MADPKKTDDDLYIDSNLGVHTTERECVEANLGYEAAQGQSVTGGNCGQDPDNVNEKDK